MTARTTLMTRFCAGEDNWLTRKSNNASDPGTSEIRDGNPAHLVLQLTSFLLRSRKQDHVGSGLVLVKNSIELLQSCINQKQTRHELSDLMINYERN